MSMFLIQQNIEFDPARYTLRCLGNPQQTETLNHSAAQCLEALIRSQGEILSHERLMDVGWELVVVTPNSLSQAIVAIRRALRQVGLTKMCIETIPKQGYRFVADILVQELDSRSSESLVSVLIPPADRRESRFFVSWKEGLWICGGGGVGIAIIIALMQFPRWDGQSVYYKVYPEDRTVFYQSGMDPARDVKPRLDKLRQSGTLAGDFPPAFIYINNTTSRFVYSYFFCPQPFEDSLQGCSSLVITPRNE